MARLIDADEVLNNSIVRIKGFIGGKYPFDAIPIQEIKFAPTVNAVVVVRCKDCELDKVCCRTIRQGGHLPDDYCSYGVRKQSHVQEEKVKKRADGITANTDLMIAKGPQNNWAEQMMDKFANGGN